MITKLTITQRALMPKESEESEVKSKQELIEKWELAIESAEFYGKGKEERLISYMKDFVSDLNQLDEPEALSQEWIDSSSVYIRSDGVTEEYVHVDDLQNLLVPEQELPVIPKFVADWISEHHEEFDLYPALRRLEAGSTRDYDAYKWYRRNTHTFVNAYLTGIYEVEEGQKYYVVKKEGLDGVHYYFTKFDDEMNGLFTIPDDKKGAYRFDGKEKAQAIANYTDSKVEELE